MESKNKLISDWLLVGHLWNYLSEEYKSRCPIKTIYEWQFIKLEAKVAGSAQDDAFHFDEYAGG